VPSQSKSTPRRGDLAEVFKAVRSGDYCSMKLPTGSSVGSLNSRLNTSRIFATVISGSRHTTAGRGQSAMSLGQGVAKPY
jgi:hypothetical protein